MLTSSSCGVWPAFWMVGTGTWPQTGEIDIIELTNSLPNNVMSLHTSATPNCTIAGSNMTGTLLTNDCAVGRPSLFRSILALILSYSSRTRTLAAPYSLLRRTWLDLPSMQTAAGCSQCSGIPMASRFGPSLARHSRHPFPRLGHLTSASSACLRRASKALATLMPTFRHSS